ncbi:hypothetical protein ABTD17_18615, partial [Acinetobacter baumannii]
KFRMTCPHCRSAIERAELAEEELRQLKERHKPVGLFDLHDAHIMFAWRRALPGVSPMCARLASVLVSQPGKAISRDILISLMRDGV